MGYDDLVADAINTFPTSPQSEAILQAFKDLAEGVLSLQGELQQLKEDRISQDQEIKALNHKLECLTERQETLERLEELYHGKPPAKEDTELLRDVFQKREEAQKSLPSRVFGLEEDIGTLEKVVHGLKKEDPDVQRPTGKKTDARIDQIKHILKTSGGSRTFQELQRNLGLSPQQFTYLVSHLDKRIFEINRRPGTKRGEKVLSLRVRIKEGVVFT
jgi:chromosome segregation ATPase